MSKILIIGNVLKDVYLKLDERQNEFEEDARGTFWLDLEFNGAAHGFFRRTSVYGGAAVSLSVLNKLGVEARIMGSQAEAKSGEVAWKDDPADYRYILCHEGEIVYFVPSSRKPTDWSVPASSPEWILVDRSTVVSMKLVDEIRNFIKFSPSTKLAVHAEKRMTPAGQRLAEMADILFLESEPPVHQEREIVDKIELGKPREQLVCHISPRKIVFGDAEESWQLSRTEMLTHLTVYSTIVATVLGVVAAGGSAEDAVLWARLNAEQATLESSLSARKLQELAAAEREKRAALRLVTMSLMTPRKGVLAADESDGTLTERLVKFGAPASEKSRKAYRELLLTAPELKDYTSGVILTEEVARRKVVRDQDFVEYLTGRGIITGVKADLGQAALLAAGSADETYTLGEEGLAERLRRYYEMGCRFAKWHARFVVGKDLPSFQAVEKAAEALANFAKECQLVGLVPMIESDVALGGDYDAAKSAEVTVRVLEAIFDKLERRKVELESVILKTNMVIDGAATVTPKEVGMATAAILRHAVPGRVGGVMLLSGGQESNQATKNLAAVYQNGPFPWPVSFAFGRALQDPVMQIWKGKAENVKAAQAALKRHLQDNAAAIR